MILKAFPHYKKEEREEIVEEHEACGVQIKGLPAADVAVVMER